MLFELAYALRMPVYKLKEEMPYEELLQWEEYFDKRPAGWQDDLRAYKIMQAFGVKEKPEALFLSLSKIKETPKDIPKGEGFISTSNLKSSALFSKMLSSTGGTRLEF